MGRQQMILIICLILAAFLIVAAFINLQHKKMVSDFLLKTLIVDKDYAHYLECIDRQLVLSLSKKSRAHYLSRKIYVYLFMGDWLSCEKLLTQFEPKYLPPVERAAYVANVILCCFLAGEQANADKWRKEFADLLEEGKKSRHSRLHVQLAQALADFHHQRYQEAHLLLESLSQEEGRTEFFLSVDHYYLAKVAKIQGRSEEAQQHLQHAIEYGKNTFLEKRARDYQGQIITASE